MSSIETLEVEFRSLQYDIHHVIYHVCTLATRHSCSIESSKHLLRATSTGVYRSGRIANRGPMTPGSMAG
jgi:hypothetical protein